MRYVELKDSLKKFTIFSLGDIKKIDSRFYRRRLNEWADKGYIRKIVKGHYIFSDLELNESVIFEIANRIYSPSYISLETALAYYNLIPESVYGITSISTRRTYRFKTVIAEFSYRTVRPALYFSYDIIKYNGKNFKIATPAKAVLDYLYSHPHINDTDDFLSLRVNKDNFLKMVQDDEIKMLVKKFGKKALTKRVKHFMEFIKNA